MCTCKRAKLGLIGARVALTKDGQEAEQAQVCRRLQENTEEAPQHCSWWRHPGRDAEAQEAT